MAKKGKPQERNLISFDSSSKQCPRDYAKARTDKTQHNSKCRLRGERDETINHISECNKLAQKEYKSRQMGS